MLHDYTTVSPESVKQETDLALAYAETLLTQAAAYAEEPSFDGTMRPIDEAWGRVAEAYGKGAFMGQVSTDEAVRNAGTAADERLTKWRVGLAFRPDLYRAVAAFEATDDAQALTGEQRHLLDVWLRDFRRAGQEIDPEVRAELGERTAQHHRLERDRSGGGWKIIEHVACAREHDRGSPSDAAVGRLHDRPADRCRIKRVAEPGDQTVWVGRIDVE